MNKVYMIILLLMSLLFAQHKVHVQSYKQGEKYYQNAQYRDALALFSQVFNKSGDRDLRAKAIYMKAISEYKLREYERSASDFADFIKIFSDHPLIYRASIYLGNCKYYSGNYFQSAQAYSFAVLSQNSREKHIAKRALSDLLNGYLPTNLFPSLLDLVQHSVEGIVAVAWLERLQFDADYAVALREGKKLLQRGYSNEDKRKLRLELDKIENYLKRNLVVAILVPQFGEFKKYGTEIFNGVSLAFSEYSRSSIKLKVIDTGGDALSAAIAMNDLLRSTTPLCIIGPIRSNETAATGAISGTFKVPLITPTASQNGIAELSPYVFQLMVSPENSSALLGAIEGEGMDTFTILAPDDELGRRCAIAFEKSVKQKGGIILAYEFYDQNTMDFSHILRDMKEPILRKYDTQIGRKSSRDDRFYKCKPNADPPDCVLKERKDWTVHIDGFFLPAYSEEIETILPQIPFVFIKTKILGTNGWVINSLKNNKKIRKYLDSTIVIPDDFYIDSEDSMWKKFEKDYYSKYRKKPSRVAALGYDAAMLVINGIKNNAVTQELMKDYLSGIYDYTGPSGPVCFDENGANTKSIILQFIDGKLIRIK